MQDKRLTTDLAVGPQITPSDVDTLAVLGFRSIIGNRPDGESPDQPAFASIDAAAQANGLEARHIPVIASRIGSEDIQAFRNALRDLPKPIFAFCRTGTRSTLLWALANPDSLTPEDRIRIAAAHGYDISAFGPRLEKGEEGTVPNA